MKKTIPYISFALLFALALASCSESKKNSMNERLVGESGNPRFNLVFDNHANVDLDLYVTDPQGSTIYYGNPTSSSGGRLDVDCMCGDCPQGPAENIYWQSGQAPAGEYKVWVQYYGACTTGNPASNFTLRIMRNTQVVQTYTGRLSSGRSTEYTFVHTN